MVTVLETTVATVELAAVVPSALEAYAQIDKLEATVALLQFEVMLEV
jgi:hypothetical protein